MSSIINAAPMTYNQGTDDKSTRALVAEPESLPTHLVKVYTYAKKGPTDPQLVSGDELTRMYHADTFDMRKKYATHQTELINTLSRQANPMMVQRVKPADAGPNASIRLWLDVLATNIPVYERMPDGSFELDVDGNKIPTGSSVAGLKVAWVASAVTPNVDGSDSFGGATQKPGFQTDSGAGTQSIAYPIMDLRAPYFGADGNNHGVRIYAPTLLSSIPVSQRLVTSELLYPIRVSCVYRADELSTPKITETQSAEQYVDVSFKPNAIDKQTDSQLYIDDVFIDAYQNLTSTTNPPAYGPFGALHTYTASINTILALAYSKEQPVFDEFSDFTGVADELHRFNIVGGTNSNGVAYNTYEILTTGTGVVRLSEQSTIYARGGSDGTMDESLFATLVSAEVQEYNNPNSVLQDLARYPEAYIYDTGFPLATKYDLCDFISIRKDTFVFLATHDVLGIPLTASQESSLAVALRTRIQLAPESAYFGTSTMRGMIVGRCGKRLNSQYTKKLPLTLEVAEKAARYMGAANGRWKSGYAFDAAPQNVVEGFTDINVTFTPATVRQKDWDNGLVWVQNFQRRSYFFPAFKTVYDDDTSVLNSFFTVAACVELQKVNERAWRQFTGSSNLTNAQLIERVNAFINENTVGRFDDRFVIVPETFFTKADEARGYSWSQRIKIYAPNMKTVAVLSLEARRIDELATA